MYLCVCYCFLFFLCDTHSQLDAYFIIRFRTEGKLKRITIFSTHSNFLLSFSFYFICLATLWCTCVFPSAFFFAISRSVWNFGFYRFLFNIRIRLWRCNDGIMIIVAKIAKDLKCDNVCCRCCRRRRCFCIDCHSATIVMSLITFLNLTYTHTCRSQYRGQ